MKFITNIIGGGGGGGQRGVNYLHGQIHFRYAHYGS